ncbi:type ISP restriction/modification enzyme [Salinimicrobium sp. TH3]|uniref:type ISP restriction/modification enzyme n=1 Tax=Salinimicrobium sp. TH3 TaxID=2997342 RepID=UPI0022732289|nr:type ISP restriction/modification enzyme [Salinimicrobium sp. TH3]MCY2685865.1 N-6 DNA methylase [Salinimicrobium sp. TH3]
MNIHQYLVILSDRYRSGISREHSYRGDLENLIRSLVPEINVTNEPTDVTDCGNPDYVLTRGKIPVGYIEAKDVGKDLTSKVYNEQFTRYREALDNLIITDYLWFRFYSEGVLVHEIRLGKIEEGRVIPLEENFKQFENLLINFCSFVGQTIRSSKKLAVMMANKARLLQSILENAITSDEKTQENTSLKGQFETFKEILIHDLTPKGFADIYAQTLAYGMFAARLHDPTLADFSRQEAAELIPKSNPFLRKLFGYVAGPDIDDRIKIVVDNLAEVFRATNVEQLLKNFGSSTQTQDAIIHFYETFLAEYDPKLRKARGVWYTPEPVVKFIVRAVDDILKTEFNLPQGIADTSKTKIKVNTDVTDKRSVSGYRQVEKEVHRVQILDPATGTGTFLAEVVNYIYSQKFEKMQGAWSGYVEEHLIPRLNGFELLMASYAMAHLKLDMLLRETGYKTNGSTQRLNVYLTNSLEEYHKDTGTLFSNWLSIEANEANHIKRDTPVMCVIGNPPYSGESANKGEWIMNLMEDYKKEPGGKKKLKERNSKSVNNDYIKFLRYGQHFIEKNGEGILAYITPHGFLDSSVLRGMRWNLLKAYDKIYTIDLHGNSTKKETAPDGSKDENVFDIKEGVSINILVKTGKKDTKELGKVLHFHCYGKRLDKYDFLEKTNLSQIPFVNVANSAPNFLMVQKDLKLEESYKEGFEVTKLLSFNSSGIKSHDDKNLISITTDELKNNIERLEHDFDSLKIREYLYRPFDKQFIYYDITLLGRAREKTIRHFDKDNIGIVLVARPESANIDVFDCLYLSKSYCDTNLYRRGGPKVFPLYLYPEKKNEQEVFIDGRSRTPNLNEEIIYDIANKLGLEYTYEKDDLPGTFAPVDLLDYIYAVLHSPTYRKTYKEFLKIDFPRVPYPKDQEKFWQLVRLGGELRTIHLLENPRVENFITSYPVDGDNKITRKITNTSPGFELTNEDEGTGKVWINDSQYFDNVPEVAWDFYIGGYQPAQKWIKDRKDRKLTFEDILHYQKIIVALTETDKLMKEIDRIELVES